MKILTLDPGGTTGVAYFETTEKSIDIIWRKQIANGLSGFLDFHWDELEDLDIDIIVCENFVLRYGVAGADITPAYIIGALEALYPVTDIVYQSPSVKPLCDDDRLKRMDLYEKARPHANDAVRHGIIYLRNHAHMPTLSKGWD